ncbi:MAG: N-acetylmuramoyl-L-alanine amidase [Steroidobacteraceae bacterium]
MAALFALVFAPLATAAALRGVGLEADGERGARLTLQLSAPVKQKVFTLENPHRLVIDLPGTQMDRAARLPRAMGPVISVRSGVQPKNTLRLVLQLREALPSQVRYMTGNAGTQLVVEVGSVAAPSVAPAAVAPVAVRPQHAPEDSGREVIVAIDAGHGGQDPGATGKSGTHEKDVVLAIARELKKRVDAEPGMRAVLTRSDDRFIALRDRIGIARAARADLFVSIHADAIRDRDVSGSSVYVLSERGASSEQARWLAERENAADLKGGVSLGDKNGQLASVLMDLSQSASIGSSMEAAERVLASLDQVGTVRKSQVQQAAFVVLKSPDIPSMLIETAYISNPGEERKLRSPAYQAELAEAILRGVREHFRRSPPDGSLFARQQRSRSGLPVIAGSAGP